MKIEVFKTNIHSTDQVRLLEDAIHHQLPESKINFDLDDCDRILRVVAPEIDPNQIIELAEEIGLEVETLPE